MAMTRESDIGGGVRMTEIRVSCIVRVTAVDSFDSDVRDTMEPIAPSEKILERIQRWVYKEYVQWIASTVVMIRGHDGAVVQSALISQFSKQM
jgi:hypothetical protein